MWFLLFASLEKKQELKPGFQELKKKKPQQWLLACG